MRGVRITVSWVLALFLAGMFLLIANETLFPATASRNIVFPTIAQASGVAYWEPTGRYLTGLADILAAFLILLPWTRRIGALLALAISVGAVAMHLTWLGTDIPVEFGQAETDNGQLFTLALGLLASSVLLVIVHPGRAKSS
ncbi:hypothetical protein GC169_03385 [bacterium]|nr:hypothetical protein [bacterium]